jgi:ribosomal protein S18 acetylase RimI-like enzyme
MVSQEADIEYLESKGFETFERLYVMARDTAQAIAPGSVPVGITLRPLALASETEQVAYLEVHNACFPENPKTVQELQFLLQSPHWETGTAIAAYSPPDDLEGGILVYRDEQTGYGVVDDVMVLPPWRGKGIAKSLVGEGLRYLRARGVSNVRLEVKANNAPAVAVYEVMGYSVVNQEILLGKFV